MVISLTAVACALMFTFSKRDPSRNTIKGSTAQAPPFVPYTIPFLGSVIQLGKYGFTGFIRHCRKELGGYPPIFTALVGGKRMHFIADPSVFGAAFRYSEKYLSIGPVIADFAGSFFGISSTGLDGLFEHREGLKPLLDHLLRTDGLKRTSALTQTSIQRHMERLVLGSCAGNHSIKLMKSADTALNMDLEEFCNQIIFRTILDVLICPDVSHDDFLKAYACFEKSMMLSFLNLPMRWLMPDSFKARGQLLNWLSGERPWAPYLQARRAYLKDSLSANDLACDMLLWTWASVSNLIPAIFWLVYHVVTTPEAVAAIRAEIDPLFRDGQSSTTLTAEELSAALTPALDSAFWEALRLRLHFLIAREVKQDMELELKTMPPSTAEMAQNEKINDHPPDNQKYFLRAGERIMMLTTILHQDPELFPNPTVYQWDRFLAPSVGEGTAKTNQIENIKPFGGGAHYCPGRKFAMTAAKAMVAQLLYGYDASIVGTAQPDWARDGMGILHSKTRVQIVLQPRQF